MHDELKGSEGEARFLTFISTARSAVELYGIDKRRYSNAEVRSQSDPEATTVTEQGRVIDASLSVPGPKARESIRILPLQQLVEVAGYYLIGCILERQLLTETDGPMRASLAKQFGGAPEDLYIAGIHRSESMCCLKVEYESRIRWGAHVFGMRMCAAAGKATTKDEMPSIELRSGVKIFFNIAENLDTYVIIQDKIFPRFSPENGGGGRGDSAGADKRVAELADAVNAVKVGQAAAERQAALAAEGQKRMADKLEQQALDIAARLAEANSAASAEFASVREGTATAISDASRGLGDELKGVEDRTAQMIEEQAKALAYLS
jgi:hypothetical protein